MKKIGLILEGKTAKNFLDKILEQYHSSNYYTILTQDQNLIPQTYPDNFKFFYADPTSLFKLQKTFNGEFDQFFLILCDVDERKEVYTLLRSLFAKVPIVLNSAKALKVEDEFLEQISIPSIISSKLLTFLPNAPSTIWDFGLGKGEIAEILVPSGSAYCHRQVGSIAQKDWKIAGIYRKNELLLSSYSLSIQPNDKLLAIGDPVILGNIYRQITNSLGQFPLPFGKDIFLYLDEDIMSENEILRDLDEALFLHQKLNSNQLYITLLHPKSFELIAHLKSIQDQKVHCIIEYNNKDLGEVIELDKAKRIGLIILHHRLFNEHRAQLYELSSPVFKTTQISIQECLDSLVFLGEHEIENIASVALDITSQLELGFEMYDYDVDGNYHTPCFEVFKSICAVFGAPFKYTQSNHKNPIFYLQSLKRPALQFLPFSHTLTHSLFTKLTSTDTTCLSADLNKFPQIYIPIPHENN
ncbi:potassium transporter TrkA [Helicobacter cholecystus]|uniref:potassium transporter TrkA n=1 Tax=Helicobacter cholecystus TaxID=45498 RepID=UPI002739C4E7|nr:potassium transporter TrkA [Helicobacter cholecystus]